MLYHPDWNRQFIDQTDASAKGLGAVLTQIDSTGRERPIRYASGFLMANLQWLFLCVRSTPSSY